MKLLLILLAAVLAVANSQHVLLPPDDNFVSRFVVKYHRAATPPATSLLASGVMLNARHSLTIASVLVDLTGTPTNVVLHFGATSLVGTTQVPAEFIDIHPNFNAANLLENNLAIVRITEANGNNITAGDFLMPRNLGRLQMGHFCSMMGFGSLPGGVMSMVPTMIRDSRQCNHLFAGNFFCAIGQPGQFTPCGGFRGSPIICDGTNLAGLVVQESFCGLNPRAYIIDVQHHQEWIWRASSGKKFTASAIIIAISVILSKIFM